ncbi:MAG: hypothetical protein SGILL_005863 [Bacillariaceae sp.]
MSTIRVFQSILPSSVFPWKREGEADAVHDDGSDRGFKRRKTRTENGGRCGAGVVMRMESNLSDTSASSMSDTSEAMVADDDFAMDGTAQNTASPHDAFALAIQNRGIPSRLDPLSIDHFVHFESGENIGRHQPIPLEVVHAMQSGGDQQQVIQHLHQWNPTSLKSLRTSEGETLLHVAAASGCHTLVEWLLQPDMQLSAMVLDRKGRSPLHSVCIAMHHSQHTAQHLETMQVLLRHSPTLVLYMDQERLTPLEYLDSSHSQRVNDLLHQENVAELVAREVSRQIETAKSGQRMSAMETVDCMVNLSGVEAAIMETGFSI